MTEGVNHWLDWLDIVPAQFGRLADLRRVSHLTEGHYFHHAELLGMGGSSLAPEMLSRLYGHGPEHQELLVLDSTDPNQIRGIQERIDLEHSPFVYLRLSPAADSRQDAAVAGAVMGINPFDQPDVEAAKPMTRELMSD